jgi:hypothetical protein
MTSLAIGAGVFIRHDIDHLSASSLNPWAAEL